VFIVLFLYLLHDFFVFLRALCSRLNCAAVLYIKKVSGSDDSLKTMGDHHDGKFGVRTINVRLL